MQEENANDSTYTFAAFTSSSYTSEFEAAVQHDLAFLKAAIGAVALYTFTVLCRWKSGLLGVRVTVTLAGAGRHMMMRQRAPRAISAICVHGV